MIIAECGLNHNGNMELAKKMICEAWVNGADLAKFQLYDTTRDEAGNPWHDYLKQCELSFDNAKMLFDYGTSVGIEVFFSVDDVERVGWCEKIGVKRYKLGFARANNVSLLKAIPVKANLIISTDTPYYNHYHKTKWLYCIPKYPAMINEIDFGEVKSYDGLSDHTIGIDCARIALARGAEIIEKHFTLDKTMYGPDHCLSMTPEELKELVRWDKLCKEIL